MQLVLTISLFSGALGEVSLPEIGPENPFQAGLILEEFDDPVGVEFLEVLEVAEELRKVVCRTLVPEVSSIAEGADFFITRGGRMLGKGTVEQAFILPQI